MAPEGLKAWECVPTGGSIQCKFKEHGDRTSWLLEVVKVCKSGDNSVEICTGKMSLGDVKSRVVDNFNSKMKLFESCRGVEYANKNSDK